MTRSRAIDASRFTSCLTTRSTSIKTESLQESYEEAHTRTIPAIAGDRLVRATGACRRQWIFIGLAAADRRRQRQKFSCRSDQAWRAAVCLVAASECATTCPRHQAEAAGRSGIDAHSAENRLPE